MSADAPEPLGSWLPTLVAPVFFSSTVTVRIISGIFITLGIAFMAPIVLLVLFDLCLWLWRLYSLSRNAFLRRQRQLREEQRERRMLIQQQQQQQQLQKQKQQQLQKQKLQQQRTQQRPADKAQAQAQSTAVPSGTAVRR